MIYARRALLRSVSPIAGAVLLAIIALALHPHLSGHPDPRAELLEINMLGMRDRLVHGALLVLLGALLARFTSYAQRRGLTRKTVVAGFVSFAVGIGALIAAGLIDGFVLPEMAARFVSASPTIQAAAVATMTAALIAVNTFSSFAIMAMSIGIAAWSLDLASDRGESRTAGIVGFISAAVSVTVVIAGGPFLTPHALIAVLCTQGVWYVWTAVLLARGTPSDASLR